MRQTSVGVGVHCPPVTCWKSYSKPNCQNSKKMLHQQYFIKLLVILTVPSTCQKDQTVDTAPLAAYGWNRVSLVFFSQGYELLFFWFMSSLLFFSRRGKWNLDAASHAEMRMQTSSSTCYPLLLKHMHARCTILSFIVHYKQFEE